MRKFKTEKRLKKIEKVAASRQFSIRVVLENIHDPHNVSAILRSCDAVGVPQVDLLYTVEKYPKISKVSSASSKKWVKQIGFSSTKKCVESLKNDGFKLYGTILSEKAKNLYEVDLTQKIAIVMGNEHRGISDGMVEALDEQIYIPMRGMIQSLNVSVATAITLYEAQRQRALKGMYEKSELSEEELENHITELCNK